MMEVVRRSRQPAGRVPATVVERGVLEVRLLGQLEVVDGEQVLTPHRQKPRALLAALALRVGRPVAKDVLVEDLWGEEPPRRATDALENYISQLRKRLGRDAIVTVPAGYLLGIPREQIDVVRFERLLAEARGAGDAQRAELVRSALGLLRGPPLADLALEPFAQPEIGRLGELALTAREDLVDAELALGRHVDVVPELEVLIAGNPYRERLRAQLMLALYRSGRQAEALEAFQETRRLLVDELGIDPGDELQDLERAILRQDATLRAPPRVEREAPAIELPPPSGPRASRKTVTVLVSELDDDGLLEDLDPELLRAVLDRYLPAVRTSVERHGGAFTEVAGDVVVGVFGVPTVHEDDALRAVRAALDMRQAVAALNDELLAADGAFVRTRTGVGTGEALVAGDALPTGRAVSEARSLAAHARTGQILVGEQTRRLVQGAVETEVLDADPGAFRVVALLPGADGRTLRLDAPLVGRGRQLETVSRAFSGAAEGRACHLFTVLGAAGVGKSRLARELVDSLGARASVLHGRCLPYGDGITYWPLLEALPADVAADLDPTAPRDRLFPRARSALETMARERPLLLVLDDLQWAEQAFLDLVEDVASTSREAPLMILCLARPELLENRPGWGGGTPNSSSLLLESLSDADSERLVDHLLGASDLPDVVRGHIVTLSEGNPLFVEELLTTLVERDVLRRTRGRWTTTESVIAVPPSIQALIAARIDRLPDDERVVLELASIGGKLFTRELVAGLVEDDRRPGLDAHLDSLVRKELVRPRTEDGFTFRHQLIRDAAYASMTKQVRADLHDRLAVLLERDGASGAELDELVAYHRDQARRYREELGGNE
jgi:DNA-binding SARP family transcriptional activator